MTEPRTPASPDPASPDPASPDPASPDPDPDTMAEATRRLAARTEGEAEGQDTLAHAPDDDGRVPLDSKMAQQGHPGSQEPVASAARELHAEGQSDH
ncbi:MAG: hypothetical protein H7287_09650 [Thermoleophilia bacterium]|nr:hypothetical protein [Thermoleophilia bacterium]